MDLPSLYQLSVKTFVRNLKHNSKSRAPISELHDLPPNVLCTVFEEMSSHSSLTEITHRELSDPVLYMRVFSLNYTARKSLEKSVCNVSRNGVCALSEMARNWCKIMSDEEKRKRYPSLATNFRGALELGTYLHDAGLAQLSAEVLYIARRMIPQDNNGLKIECVRSILRAEVSALYKMKAEETCRTLLTMVDDTTDDEVRIKVFLEVTKHHFKACRYSEMNRWIQKAQEFITETTPPEIVIECQQLNALHLFHSKMILDAYSIFKQAIDRTREIFGHHHRRYAETLYTFGATLVKNRYCYGFQMLLYGIQMLIEVLIIFTTLYGERTPHANDIYRYLALGFNRLVKSLGRMYRSCNRLLNTVLVAQLVMNHHGVSSHFVAVATLIIQSTPCELMLAIGNSDFSSAEEIKEICSKMSKKLDVSEPTTM